MQTLKRKHMVVIKDYEHMITIDETNTSIVIFLAKPLGPFCTSTFTSWNLIVLLDAHAREKNNTSPLCILRMLMPQIVSLRTLTLVHTWYEESTPRAKSHWILDIGKLRVVAKSFKIVLQPITIQLYLHVPLTYCCRCVMN